MKIELTDRGQAIKAAELVVAGVLQHREASDAAYVEVWRNHRWAWVRRRRVGKMPPISLDTWGEYPNVQYQWQIERANRVLAACKSASTGTIFLEFDEFNAISSHLKGAE